MEQPNKHQKHAKLARPELGKFARNEVAFLGAPCEDIENLMSELVQLLADKWSVVAIDADHKNKVKGFIQNQELRYTFENELPASYPIDHYFQTNHADLALVNGNHYEAVNQVLILDKSKIASVEKRIHQLTNIMAVIVKDADPQDYPFLDFPANVKFLSFNSQGFLELAKMLSGQMAVKIPKLEVLILAGGKSTRMGIDKSQLKYGGSTAIDRLIQLCLSLGLEVNLSVAADSNENLTSIKVVQYIEDQFIGLGPFGAICSAFMKKPDSAFLVLACDLPLIDKQTISNLIENRKAMLYATAVRGYEAEFPEPLVAIYEPKAYLRFLQFLSLGYSCPRKVLINSPIEILQLSDNETITNVNTQEEYQSLIQQNHASFR